MKLFYKGPSLTELHEEYAKRGRLDEEAPVKSINSVTIDAPVHTVWQLISDMHNWPAWRSDARVTELERMEPDANFRWTVRGTSIKSTFAVISPEEELTWTGVAMGCMKAIDRMRLAPTARGGTLATIEESLSGPLLTLFYSDKKLRKGHQDVLRMLKAAAEGQPLEPTHRKPVLLPQR
ncbi:SRPBCC family protein [Streptomyces sp. NPDC014776]|uniref:SRPBCC family protein n=1 Tax=unclassified Streptomyces TaxID=2593676 RepID=UPI0036FB0A41